MKNRSYLLMLLAVGACNNESTTAPFTSADDLLAANNIVQTSTQLYFEPAAGMVYTLSNQSGGNAVLAFHRAVDGTLTPGGSFATGGNGGGSGLGSQNAVVLSPDGTLLFAVNAGSNTVTSFRVVGNSLTLVGSIASGGTHPISVTSANGLLFVLNDGGNGNISGFNYTSNGNLSAIPNSTRALTTSSSVPAQIQFNTDATRLVVTEKGTNRIGVYNVSAAGIPSNVRFAPSAGQTPFGFAIRGSTLIVSEAFGGNTDASVVSSYDLGRSERPVVRSGAVPTTETAACWVAVTPGGTYAYAANTGSNTITGYRVSPDGYLAILNANGETAKLGAGAVPTDVAISPAGVFLYSLASGTHMINTLRLRPDGSMELLSRKSIGGLPAGTIGIATN